MDPILANGASALLAATLYHLIFGNLIIGLIEGFLISRTFPVSQLKCSLIAIPANYASAWISLLFSSWLGHVFGLRISLGEEFFWIGLIAAFGLTLLVELPFFHWITNDQYLESEIVWRGLLKVNLVTYLLIIMPWYIFAHIINWK